MRFFDPECGVCGARVANLRRHLGFHQEGIAHRQAELRSAQTLLEVIRTLVERSVFTRKAHD